jgi:ubiquitin-conjugating enzyme E2 D/E
MSNAAMLRRLCRESEDLKNNAADLESIFKINRVGDDMCHYNVILFGPKDSLYEGYQFNLDIKLPHDYPFSAPIVKFITPIEHVNVNNNGDICLDILKDKWVPSQNIASIMKSLMLLLSEPNVDDPLNSDLGRLYKTDKNKYKQRIKSACEKFSVA